MIRVDDLKEAIAECQGERHPNANTCIKLAAYYTIMRELTGEKPAEQAAYVYDPGPPEIVDEVMIDSDTDFARAANGIPSRDLWPVMDELMSAVRALYPKLYDATMRRVQEL